MSGLWTMYAFWPIPGFLAIGPGKYAGLLGVNLYGLLLCTGLYLLPIAVKAVVPRRAVVPLSLQGARQ